MGAATMKLRATGVGLWVAPWPAPLVCCVDASAAGEGRTGDEAGFESEFVAVFAGADEDRGLTGEIKLAGDAQFRLTKGGFGIVLFEGDDHEAAEGDDLLVRAFG